MNTEYEKSVKKINRRKNRQAMGTVNNLCLLYVLTSVCVYLLSVGYRRIVPYLENLLGYFARAIFGCGKVYAELLAKSVIGSPVNSYFVSMLVSFVGFFVPFVLYSRYIEKRSFGTVAPVGGKLLKGFLPVYAASQFMASAAAIFSQSIGSFIIPDIFAKEEAALSGGYAAGSVFDLVVIFLLLCVFTPFAEEFVFRGVVYGSLRRFGIGFATVASSLIFGLAHGSVTQLAYATAFGFALAIVFEKTGSLKTSILFHFFNNFLNYALFVLIPYFADMAVSNIVSLIYNAICGVIAIVGLVILFSKKDSKTEENADETDTREERQETSFGWFFSPGTILLIMNFIFNIYISLSV